jgi:hypothetical protein
MIGCARKVRDNRSGKAVTGTSRNGPPKAAQLREA